MVGCRALIKQQITRSLCSALRAVSFAQHRRTLAQHSGTWPEATAARALWHVAQKALDIAVRKNWGSHIDASHSRQPLVKGERLVRYEVNAVISTGGGLGQATALTQQRLPVTRPPTVRFAPAPGRPAQLPAGRHACVGAAPRWQGEVTPKGVLPIAVCHASATREEPGKPKRPPRTKIM